MAPLNNSENRFLYLNQHGTTDIQRHSVESDSREFERAAWGQSCSSTGPEPGYCRRSPQPDHRGFSSRLSGSAKAPQCGGSFIAIVVGGCSGGGQTHRHLAPSQPSNASIAMGLAAMGAFVSDRAGNHLLPDHFRAQSWPFRNATLPGTSSGSQPGSAPPQSRGQHSCDRRRRRAHRGIQAPGAAASRTPNRNELLSAAPGPAAGGGIETGDANRAFARYDKPASNPATTP